MTHRPAHSGHPAGRTCLAKPQAAHQADPQTDLAGPAHYGCTINSPDLPGISPHVTGYDGSVLRSSAA